MNNNWEMFSRKLVQKIERPFCAGVISEQMALQHRMRLVVSKEISQSDASIILFWLIDPSDGIIADAKFQVYGSSLLIGAAEALCDAIVGKNSLQASRITAEHIEKQLRDHSQKMAFAQESLKDLNPLIKALHQGIVQCRDIPIDNDIETPIPTMSTEGKIFENWLIMSKPEKLIIIEEVLSTEVRPYVEMDEGGVEVVDLENDYELIIAYKGACTSCFSSIGATLSGIQEILRAKIHPEIVVSPQMDGLNLG